MKFWIVVFLFLVDCRGSVNDNDIMDAVHSKYLSFDSIPLEIWDSTLPRQGREPYELEKSVFDRKLNLRFDYYIFNNDGQLFPLKQVVVSNDTFSYLLDFKEEYDISNYKVSDSTLPVLTIGNQLNELFNSLSLDKRLQIMVTYKILYEIMGMDYVRPYHREISLKQFDKNVDASPIKKINKFYDVLEQRGDILFPEKFELNPREYDIYNLDDYKCFYKINFKDSFYVECLFPEEYDIFLW